MGATWLEQEAESQFFQIPIEQLKLASFNCLLLAIFVKVEALLNFVTKLGMTGGMRLKDMKW